MVISSIAHPARPANSICALVRVNPETAASIDRKSDERATPIFLKQANMKTTQSAVKTVINGSFPGHAKPAKKPPAFVDLATLAVCNDPLPRGRQVTAERKYDALFAALKPGQCIKCAPESVGQISGALRKYIKTNKLKDHIVRTVLNYEGTGTGRVWLLYVGRAS